VKLFLNAHPMDYTQGADPNTAAAFGVPDCSLPVTLLIDKQYKSFPSHRLHQQGRARSRDCATTG
jgi:hypothetical protein